QSQPFSDNIAILFDHFSPTDPAAAKFPSDPHPNWLNIILLFTHYTNDDTDTNTNTTTNFFNLHSVVSDAAAASLFFAK
ncbi:hypothetical protein PIB30_100456, partial [Stylosanthes scabra]|nr:hypothetical protein [Stylosanthes scabra]